MNQSLHILDLLGTFAFAISGALRAIRHDLDLLGIAVLATVTGVGGGVIRDLVLGATPPSAFIDQTYIIICIAAALITFVAAPRIESRWNHLRIADAVGLGVFAAIGAAKAESMDSGFLAIVILSVTTACGGGVLRDILVAEVPLILRVDFYASAAILGALSFIAADALGCSSTTKLVTSILVTYLARSLAMRFEFALPRPGKPAAPSGGDKPGS